MRESEDRYSARLFDAAEADAAVRVRPSSLRLAVEVNNSRVCASKGLFLTHKAKKGQCILCERAWCAKDIPVLGVSHAWGLVQRWLSTGPPLFAAALCRNDAFAESQLAGKANELDAQMINLFEQK
jgi:hypothetical protein